MQSRNNENNIAFWRKWLEKYRSFKCLWDTTAEATAHERLMAWNELINLAKNVNKNANAIYVRGRLQKYFYQYKLEAKKVRAAKANGIQYEPAIFYYKIFESFLAARQPNKRHDYQNQNFWRKVIEKFVSLKCLWDYKNRKFYKKSAQDKAYNELLLMIKPNYPWADLKFVKQRINSLRNCFRREKRRVFEDKRNGVDYKPTLFYYDLLAPLYEEDESNAKDICIDPLLTKLTPKKSDAGNFENRKKWRKTKKNKFEAASIDPEIKVWTKVIRRYVRDFKCLWDQENKKEYTRYERFKAYNELLKIVKPLHPNADVEFLKRKFNILRTSYRREEKRLSTEKANGRACETRLYYFDLLSPIYQKDCLANNSNRNDDYGDDDEVKADENSDKTDDDDGEADYDNNDEDLNIKKKISKSRLEGNLWSKIIKKYVSFKCLWDHKKTYSKPERLKAWMELLKMVKLFEPNANLKYLKKRFNCFRTNYRRELKKINEARDQGIDYNSRLYFFNLLRPIYQSDCESFEYSSDEECDVEVPNIKTEVEEEVRAEFAKKISKKQAMSDCSMDCDLWRKFIKKYIAFKCLWDHKNYKLYTKAEKSAAWKNLLYFVKSSYPMADLAYIKTRVRVFRTVFKKEQRKILAAEKNGIQLKSTVFYYDLMSPLYEKDGNIDIEYSSDESTNDSKTDLTHLEFEALQLEKKDNPKNLALQKKLQDLGFICGPFETENLSEYKKAWLKIIKKYVSFKCLWDSKNRENYKSYEREAAWLELLNMVKTIIAEADMAFVKHRLQSMRSNFCRNYQKAKEVKESGFEPEVSLYYFNAISPIYQEGFPLLKDENEDPQTEHMTLNPKFATYFPDDDDDENEVIVKNEETTGGFDDYTELDGRFEATEHFPEMDYSPNESLEMLDEDAEEFIIDRSCGETELSQMTANAESATTYLHYIEHSNVENYDQDHTTVNKQKFSQDFYSNYERACKISKFGDFDTFETKIAQHLESMSSEQYLLAEKLITDVCLYGRLKKLTIESGVIFKKA